MYSTLFDIGFIILFDIGLIILFILYNGLLIFIICTSCRPMLRGVMCTLVYCYERKPRVMKKKTSKRIEYTRTHLKSDTKERLQRKSLEYAHNKKIMIGSQDKIHFTWTDLPLATTSGVFYHLELTSSTGYLYNILFDADTLEVFSFEPLSVL